MALASTRFFAGLALAAVFLPACGDDGADGTGGSDSTSPASSSSGSTGTGECLGIDEDGVCVGKCDPATCAAGNICVGNRCTLPCEGAVDCYAGTTCQDGTDDDGAAVKACLPSGKAAILGANCFFGSECSTWTVCPDGTACGASLCGGQACTDGKCPDGTACVPQTCDAAACRAPRCYGANEDAANSPSGTAFCTQDDCTQDSDCVQGMYCAITRDFHPPCGLDDFPAYRADGPCIDPADFTTDGKTFQLGTATLLRNTCLPRTQCSPCEDDLDCSGKLGQVCASIGGEKRCASLCNEDAECGAESACLDDSAHAGEKVCTPRYGSCVGDGEFCGPCLSDLDCGEPSSPMVCDPVSLLFDGVPPATPSAIGGQRGCFDLSLPDECDAQGDNSECPAAPGGLHGECLSGSEYFSPGDGFYEHCFFPYDLDSGKYSCNQACSDTLPGNGRDVGCGPSRPICVESEGNGAGVCHACLDDTACGSEVCDTEAHGGTGECVGCFGGADPVNCDGGEICRDNTGKCALCANTVEGGADLGCDDPDLPACRESEDGGNGACFECQDDADCEDHPEGHLCNQADDKECGCSGNGAADAPGCVGSPQGSKCMGASACGCEGDVDSPDCDDPGSAGPNCVDGVCGN